ncbi:MAG: RIP metalloprotease RseP [Sulfuriflexus sp.]|nr:RIP metalloprotease RseP [Sulfuriflexus sp.]
MSEILLNIAAFILVIGILVTFHEFGHFWVARRCGVKVLRFSIGFGKPIYTWHGADGVEYVLASIPLGGYVKMLDERNDAVDDADLPYSFNQKSLWARIAIVAAGPIFNFILAIVVYWSIFMIGTEGLKPVVAEVTASSIAMQAGVQQGDEILAVDGEDVQTWEIAGLNLIAAVVEGQSVTEIAVKDANGENQLRKLVLQGVSVDFSKVSVISKLGIKPQLPVWPAIIDKVIEGEAADIAGLMRGDEVLMADNQPINDWRDWVGQVQKKPRETMSLTVFRADQELQLSITPGMKSHNEVQYGYVGAVALPPPAVPAELKAVVQYSFLAAWGKAAKKTWQISNLTLRMLGKMLVGEASVKNISGPLTIAQYAGRSASIGLIQFLSFLAIVSISLGVLNLLPIPVLDGGHLLYYLVELIKGSPVSEKIQLFGQQMGMLALGALMLLALYNDVMRLL